ncbi:response regulator [Pseudocnuella soli]|uniref:response regulator n=1 Tax=Pseudocnuella soli TaxID=2502779 RepID=UPI00104A2B0A|nr:response regulator [Pseudocnuella soli]
MAKSTILYAEDDLDDLYIVEQAFAPFADQINLVHVTDGGSALSCLDRLCAGGQEPCLVLLDINMPVMDGWEALQSIRRSDATSHLPVAVFTTSCRDADAELAKQWNARFFTKPVSFDDLQHLASTFINMCRQKAAGK